MTHSSPQALWTRPDRLSTLASALIISLMLGCATASLAQVIQLSYPSWQTGYLVPLGVLVALESMVSSRALKGESPFDPEWLRYRGTELVVILLAVKLVGTLQYGSGQLLQEAPLWSRDFFTYFTTVEYGFGCLVTIFIWLVASALTGDLIMLEADERILRQEQESGLYEERDQARERLVGTLLAIGVGMVLLVALLRSEAVTQWAKLPQLQAGVTNLLAYFLLFLVLTSLTQFSLMRIRWLRERLRITPQIPRRWLLYSAALIAGLAILARLLPTGYSIGLLAILNYLLSLAILIVSTLMVLLTLPFFWLLNWLSRLFGATSEPLPPPQFPVPPPPAHYPAGSSPPLLELLKSMLFWVILLAVVGYSLTHYVRERKELLSELRRLPFFPLVERFWSWLAHLFSRAGRSTSAAVKAGWERLRAVTRRETQGQAWNYLSLRRLSARQRVQFYYLALVRRAGEAGWARQPAQTPSEYAHSLVQGLEPRRRATGSGQAALEADLGEPQVRDTLEPDIHALTERFEEARYSLHPVSPQEAGLARRSWERLRRVFRPQ